MNLLTLHVQTSSCQASTHECMDMHFNVQLANREADDQEYKKIYEEASVEQSDGWMVV